MAVALPLSSEATRNPLLRAVTWAWGASDNTCLAVSADEFLTWNTKKIYKLQKHVTQQIIPLTLSAANFLHVMEKMTILFFVSFTFTFRFVVAGKLPFNKVFIYSETVKANDLTGREAAENKTKSHSDRYRKSHWKSIEIVKNRNLHPNSGPMHLWYE